LQAAREVKDPHFQRDSLPEYFPPIPAESKTYFNGQEDEPGKTVLHSQNIFSGYGHGTPHFVHVTPGLNSLGDINHMAPDHLDVIGSEYKTASTRDEKFHRAPRLPATFESARNRIASLFTPINILGDIEDEETKLIGELYVCIVILHRKYK
jgi:hypothetical protein